MQFHAFWGRNLQNSEGYKILYNAFILRVGSFVPTWCTFHINLMVSSLKVKVA